MLAIKCIAFFFFFFFFFFYIVVFLPFLFTGASGRLCVVIVVFPGYLHIYFYQDCNAHPEVEANIVTFTW